MLGARLKLFCILIIVLGLAGQECHADRKKRVLVLHSYHQGLEWTDNITKGIQSVFSPFYEFFEIHYEYLDTKRNVGKEYMEQMVKFIAARNALINYEVVIVSDNNALKLINEGFITFRGNPPVVFCGINNYNPAMTDGIEQVTGVAETTDHRATIDLMMKLHPGRRRIVVVLDRTPTGESIHKEFEQVEALYRGKLEFKFYRDFLLEEVPKKFSLLGDNDIVYILTFNRDRKNNFISYTEGIEMISRYSKVPIYGSWDFYLGKGIVGGRVTSGFLQGKGAGKLALDILQGARVENMAVVTNSPTQYMFDYNFMTQFGIDRSSLPEDSVIINAPHTPYERYRILLLVLTLSSLTVAAFILWRYKQQQSILVAKQALALELEQKVGERTRELEVLNKELQRLSNLDGLTQLYNRRYFDTALPNEINRLQRSSSPLSLLLCDIDFFKKYNDTYGHLAGDDCIRTVAETIRLHGKRVSDVPARYGGEEFAVILPNTGAKEAVKVAEAIRRDIALLAIPHASSPVREYLTISIGVASIIPDIRSAPSTIISLADEALYASKHAGRDRVTLKATQPGGLQSPG